MLYINFLRYVALVERLFTEKPAQKAQREEWARKVRTQQVTILEDLGLSVTKVREIPMSIQLTRKEIQAFDKLADWVDETLGEKVYRLPLITAKKARKEVERIHGNIRMLTNYHEASATFLILFGRYDTAVRNQFSEGIFELPDEAKIPVAEDQFLARLIDGVHALLPRPNN